MKKYLSIILLTIATTSLTSCLKDGKVNLPPGGSPPVIEFSTTLLLAPTSDVNSPVALYTKSYDVVPTGTIEMTVGYTGGAPAPEDITVNLDNEGADKITAYNDYADVGFEMMPTTLFSGMPSSVVIKKGENFAKFTLTFKPDQFDFARAFVLPLHISSVSSGTVSGNYSTILLAVGAKNKYDGVYHVDPKNSSVTDASNVYEGFYPTDVEFRTVDATTVDVFNLDFGNYYYILHNIATDGYANFGATRFKFDPATDKVISVTGRTNATLGNLVPGGPNQFTDSPKELKIKYTSTSGRYTINDVYTYTGSR